MTKDTNPFPEAITIDNTENSSSMDYAMLFKTPKELLDDEVKLAMKAQFAALQNMFTQRLDEILDQIMQVLLNI